MKTPEPSFTYRAIVRSVYDADTIRVDLDLGCNIWLRNEPLRLFGINAPEVRGPEREEGLISRDYVRTVLSPGQEIVVETLLDKKGKYGRLLANIWLHDWESSLNDILVEKNLAKVAEY